MNRAFLFIITFIGTPILLIASIIYLSYLTYQQNRNPNLSLAVSYAALPDAQNVLDAKIIQKDARIAVVYDFFKKYDSELLPFSEDVVRKADKYGLDYRLLPAIAMQESNLCKKAPSGSFNCWGFGIYGKQTTKFDNYPQAIESVSKTLGNYKKDGLIKPGEIVKKYTPSNSGNWAQGVTHFINQLQIQ